MREDGSAGFKESSLANAPRVAVAVACHSPNGDRQARESGMNERVQFIKWNSKPQTRMRPAATTIGLLGGISASCASPSLAFQAPRRIRPTRTDQDSRKDRPGVPTTWRRRCRPFSTTTNEAPVRGISSALSAFDASFLLGAENLSPNDLVINADSFDDLAALDPESTNAAFQSLATQLGYAVGAGSVMLYTPIAIRLLRQKSAEGLTLATWICKLASFTCTDVYNIRNGFPVAAFSETLVITFESAAVLALCAMYQNRVNGLTYAMIGAYLAAAAWALLSPVDSPLGISTDVISALQVTAIGLNTAALLPQLRQNFERKSSGDYSPVTASVAAVCCMVRLFTTTQLAGGDELLMTYYGVTLLMNLSVLSQTLYYGTQREGKSLSSLFLADVMSEDGGDGARSSQKSTRMMAKEWTR